jgi:hypothetical protein
MTGRDGSDLGRRLEVMAPQSRDFTEARGASAWRLATIVVWGMTGPVFHFSDTWQLVINTGRPS